MNHNATIKTLPLKVTFVIIWDNVKRKSLDTKLGLYYLIKTIKNKVMYKL